MTAYINQFLWDIVIRSFMWIVRCGEYPPLTTNIYNQDEMKEAFTDHAEYLARIQVPLFLSWKTKLSHEILIMSGLLWRCWENEQWFQEEFAARNKRRRQTTFLETVSPLHINWSSPHKSQLKTYLHGKLKKWRLEEVLSHPSLVGLATVIEKFCSNDEKNNEFPAWPLPCWVSSKIAMQAKVLQLPWHSAQVEHIMIGLDWIRVQSLEYEVQKPGSPPPCIWRHLEEPQDSSRLHVSCLPISFYNES